MQCLKQMDQVLLLFFNSFHNDFWDKAVTLFTSIEIWIPFYLLLAYTIIKTFKRNAIYILILIALAITLSDQFAGLIKSLVQRQRPTQDPVLSSLVHNICNRGGRFGFFSAHAANAFTIAIIATKLFKNHFFSILMFTWAVLVSYTRIYLGLHYPGDILTGWIWGILTGLAFYRLMVYVQCQHFKDNPPEIARTAIAHEDAMRLILFLMIYVATILVTIDRLAKYHFFSS